MDSIFHKLADENVKEWDILGIFKGLHRGIIDPQFPPDENAVRIMTLQQSKGLTADHLIIIGCIEGLIPSEPRNESLRSIDQSHYREEQRRLFYVGITRARKSLVLSSVLNMNFSEAKNNGAKIVKSNGDMAQVRTSTFISELGPECPRTVFEDEWNY